MRKGFWILVLSLGFLALIFYALFFSLLLKVQEIRVQGAETLSDDALTDRVVFSSIPFVPGRNILLLDGEATKKGIEETFPKIRDVKVRRVFPRILLLQVVERQEILVWCQSACFRVDEAGIAFEDREGPGSLTLYKEGGEAELRERVLSPEDIGSVLRFRESVQEILGMKEFGITIPSFRVISQETLYAHTSEGWEIYMSLQEDLAWQTAKFGAVFERELSQERRGSLEYVDVRFGDQAYVK